MTLVDTLDGWVRRLVAVILAMTAATAALVGAPAPAGAAVCSASSGVSVVVDFNGATSGVQSACVAGGAGQTADQVIGSAGFALDYVSRTPGFICRVNGVPASDPCVNTPPPNAYWGLFYSDGKDGAWHYADIGAGGLQVPDGGYIGLAWQTGVRREPGLPATVHPSATPTPTETPTTAPTTPPPSSPSTSGSPTSKPTKTGKPRPTNKPTSKPTTSPTSTPTAAPTTPPVEPTSDPASPSTTPTDPPTSESPPASATETPTSAEPSETESSAVATTTSPSSTPSDTDPTGATPEDESGRVPTWLTLTIIALLLIAIGMSTYAARRRTQH